MKWQTVRLRQFLLSLNLPDIRYSRLAVVQFEQEVVSQESETGDRAGMIKDQSASLSRNGLRIRPAIWIYRTSERVGQARIITSQAGEIPSFGQNGNVRDNHCLSGTDALKDCLAFVFFRVAIDVLGRNPGADELLNDVPAMRLARRKADRRAPPRQPKPMRYDVTHQRRLINGFAELLFVVVTRHDLNAAQVWLTRYINIDIDQMPKVDQFADCCGWNQLLKQRAAKLPVMLAHAARERRRRQPITGTLFSLNSRLRKDWLPGTACASSMIIRSTSGKPRRSTV